MDFKISKQMKNNILKKLYGVDPQHLTISKSIWDISIWDTNKVPYLQHNSKLMDNLDKLKSELYNTEKNTTVKPEMTTQKPNIMTNVGMTEMGKRNTGESTSTNSHHAVGAFSNTETLNDTELSLEANRKEIAVRKTNGQIERYSSAFSRDDYIDTSYDIREAGIFTAASNGILMSKVTFDTVHIGVRQLVTISTTISHENGTDD